MRENKKKRKKVEEKSLERKAQMSFDFILPFFRVQFDFIMRRETEGERKRESRKGGEGYIFFKNKRERKERTFAKKEKKCLSPALFTSSLSPPPKEGGPMTPPNGSLLSKRSSPCL